MVHYPMRANIWTLLLIAILFLLGGNPVRGQLRFLGKLETEGNALYGVDGYVFASYAYGWDGEEHLTIKGFHFDGKAPQTYIIVGKADEPDEKGIALSLKGLADMNLYGQVFTGQDLTLNRSIRAYNYKYLSVYSFSAKADLGHIHFNYTVPGARSRARSETKSTSGALNHFCIPATFITIIFIFRL